ncbi:MAG: hypothetical protein R2853_21180 [Thermomicrobiales bacterium]
MDDNLFDAVSKRLGAAPLTRGRLLRGVFGAAAAAAGAVLPSSTAGAKHQRKPRDRQQAGSNRRDRVTAESPTILPPGKQRCRPAGYACDGAQFCCAGSCEPTGPGAARRCVASPACGAAAQACCANEVCLEGLTCQAAVCVADRPACGAVNQACCASGDPCQGGLACQGETCQPACGATGQVCCAGEACAEGLACLGGYCVPPCGGAAQICCNLAACGPNLACAGDPGACQSCGGNGDICCAGDACDAPFQCLDGTCVSFGLACKSGETATQCCNRSVRKGCKRKRQSKHARKKCLKKGKQRCTALHNGA